MPTARGGGHITYSWTGAARCHCLHAEIQGVPALAAAGSEEEFIAEHYWGYVRQRDGSTLEYHVEHPRWRLWKATAARLDCDVGDFYGQEFQEALGREPCSAFVAEGSPVAVYRGQPLPRGWLILNHRT